MRKVFFASDHAGFILKKYLTNFMKNNINFHTIDLGCFEKKSCDFPDFAQKVVNNLRQEPENFGVLICKTGIGMSIHTNRFQFIRAALCFSVESAELTRQHNDANILCLGSCYFDDFTIYEQIVKIFLQTDFLGGKYQKRIDLIDKYSKQ